MQLLIDDIRRIAGLKTEREEPSSSQDRPLAPPLSIEEGRNREGLLAEVKGEVTARLAQSLPYAVLMKLLKETSPQEVRRPWDPEVKISAHRSVLLAPDTEMIEIFDEEAITGKLLILGAPGAGKTTTLLQLAQELVKRAEPTPVSRCRCC